MKVDKLNQYLNRINEINEGVLFQRLWEKEYRDQIAKIYLIAFHDVYNSPFVFSDDANETNGMIYIPTMFRSQKTGEEWLGLGMYDVTNRGSLHNWILLHPEYKVIDSRDFKKKLNQEEYNVLIPCDFSILISIIGGYKSENIYNSGNYNYNLD